MYNLASQNTKNFIFKCVVKKPRLLYKLFMLKYHDSLFTVMSCLHRSLKLIVLDVEYAAYVRCSETKIFCTGSLSTDVSRYQQTRCWNSAKTFKNVHKVPSTSSFLNVTLLSGVLKSFVYLYNIVSFRMIFSEVRSKGGNQIVNLNLTRRETTYKLN